MASNKLLTTAEALAIIAKEGCTSNTSTINGCNCRSNCPFFKPKEYACALSDELPPSYEKIKPLYEARMELAKKKLAILKAAKLKRLIEVRKRNNGKD